MKMFKFIAALMIGSMGVINTADQYESKKPTSAVLKKSDSDLKEAMYLIPVTIDYVSEYDCAYRSSENVLLKKGAIVADFRKELRKQCMATIEQHPQKCCGCVAAKAFADDKSDSFRISFLGAKKKLDDKEVITSGKAVLVEKGLSN